MRAIVIEQFGAPDAMTERELDVPEPGPGEVRVRLDVAGVNFIDIYMRNGSYAKSHTYRTPLPMTLGMEGGGTVDALGKGADGFTPGERVAYCLARGSYAEFAIVPAWRLVKVPRAVPIDAATALMLQGITAHYLTHSIFNLQAGNTCLVHAAAGGVGQLLTQLAKARGAIVLGTVSTEEKARIARDRSCDHVIRYRDCDFREEVMRITGGKGVDVVYDSVGKDTIERSIRSLKRRGLCVMYGASSGQVACIAPLELAEAGSVYFTRPHLADYTADAAEISGRANDLFDYYAKGVLRVSLHQVFELGAAQQAHRLLESGQTRGKLLLKVAH